MALIFRLSVLRSRCRPSALSRVSIHCSRSVVVTSWRAHHVLYLCIQPLYEGYILWVDSFAVPLLLLSYFLLLGRGSRPIGGVRSLFASGLALGLSVLFKQPLALIVVLAFSYLIWQRSSRRQ